jgi:hypothetical protein
MKTILIVLYFLSAVSANAQDNIVSTTAKNKPTTGATAIYVKHVSFDSVVNKLTERGFSFEQIIKNSSIKAKHKISSISFVRYSIRYQDSTAEIIGTTFGNELNQNIIFNEFPTKKQFMEMNDFALSLNGEISYEK